MSGLSGCFLYNLHGQPWNFNVWTELSELSCKFRRHYIVLDITALAYPSVQILSMRETGP